MKRTFLVMALVLSVLSVAPAVPALASGTWTWPVGGPVIRAFDPPGSPYGSGHRGIDIAAPVGTAVRAPASGVVTFAGSVGGRLFVTIDHGGGLLSTCSFLSALLVHEGDLVVQGQDIALSGTGHVGDAAPNVHLGVRLVGQYVDPMDYLAPMSIVDLIRLAPIVPASG
jgi:murein DD-endopeptidase MepM/ murein hydrolase activator NlpD